MSRLQTASLIAANLLLPIAILTFAAGFFPYKPFLSGLAQYEALEYGAPPEAPFNKVIFMVVDALRSDFVYSNTSGFAFTQSLISSGAAIPFTAHATSPTITMPRIKAITTGSTPSFLDVILNFAESDTSSSLATQDTWLAQMKTKGSGKMVMYGDDTWLKLFPGTFDRADGTSSFFVSDFTEVDNNVTRHLPDELNNDDWSTMILHYLGLDHIGHKTGPHGPNMIPKQREMDGIVRQIFEAMESKDFLNSTLLVLCGDHGMNDAGNHGGSAAGETSPALVFLSPKLKTISSGLVVPAPYEENFQYYGTVEQSDIAPTLGALLGFPVPRNNLGAFLPDFLQFWPRSRSIYPMGVAKLIKLENDKIQILLRNARQILSVVTATFPAFEDAGPSTDCHTFSGAEELACGWRSINEGIDAVNDNSEGDGNGWLLEVEKWLKQAQDLMSSTASNYDITKLITGQMLSAVALLFACTAVAPTISGSLKPASPIFIMAIAYGVMMFASSYVEEEQHFWYWMTSTWLLVIWIKMKRNHAANSYSLAAQILLIFVATRISRRWNQTGQKFAGEPDIARHFFPEHKYSLLLLVLLTYLWNMQSLISSAFTRFPRGRILISMLLTTAAISFKVAFAHEDSPELLVGFAKKLADDGKVGASLVTQAQVVFGGLALCLGYNIGSGFGERGPNRTMFAIHNLLTLFLITQSRVTNIPLLLIFEIQYHLLWDVELNLIETTTTSLLLQYMSFFAFGGSNAISSVDLSSAYNGVSGYNVIGVGVLTFVSNWTGPVFWVSVTSLMLVRLKKTGVQGAFFQHMALLTVFVTCSLLFVMAACTILRSHLFIWTVFSPKFLYSMAWSLGQHLCVNAGLGGLLYWLGCKYLFLEGSSSV
ncbi:gpi ethanolamine phosphate transferase 2 [Phlyctema vagabunda]|uniref:GPI ethanolamine phosphate transferase 2 n=1 Tax=Phlyctema vagabunda TaxID=108571 RepID=A0ABR4PQN6_9HELO